MEFGQKNFFVKLIFALECQNIIQIIENDQFFYYASGDKGKSNKPARILLVGSHGENCKKNVVGEYISPNVDKMLGVILNEYGNIFDIHAHAFIVDANAANSPSMKAFKAALSDIKNEIIDVSNFFFYIYLYNYIG